MKALATATLLLWGLLAAGPAAAHLPGPPLPPAAPARPGVRSLVRYLAAVLRLTPAQAAAVQQTLRNRSSASLAPEDLLASLSPVLSLDAQQRLHSLQGDAATYRALYYLAARH